MAASAAPTPLRDLASSYSQACNAAGLEPSAAEGKFAIVKLYLKADDKVYELRHVDGSSKFVELEGTEKADINKFFEDAIKNESKPKSETQPKKETDLKSYTATPLPNRKPLTVNEMNQRLADNSKISKQFKALESGYNNKKDLEANFNAFLNFFDLKLENKNTRTKHTEPERVRTTHTSTSHQPVTSRKQGAYDLHTFEPSPERRNQGQRYDPKRGNVGPNSSQQSKPVDSNIEPSPEQTSKGFGYHPLRGKVPLDSAKA
ncbi:hypothetical protein SOPP22_10245 [Shewanella sp. OPT22]|nr:hypothetical protein SOPP22_10245 [Shewanella sp. OPT22]